jgi:NAD-dependent dihydropyrimidine dehydrogenase PreA subunit
MVLRYLKNGESLVFDAEKCAGCGDCVDVCPHAVWEIADRKARILDRSLCMECGACARNCPEAAIKVKTGVGCAAAVISGMIRGKPATCGCGDGKAKADKAASSGSCCG